MNQICGRMTNVAREVIRNGVCGLTYSQSCAPNHGAGREMKPRLLSNTPEKVPSILAGTTFEINDW